MVRTLQRDQLQQALDAYNFDALQITTPNGAGSSPQSPQEDPFPITNDPVHEPGRNV